MGVGFVRKRPLHPNWMLAVILGTAAFDGFDLQAMAFVASGLAREWDVGLSTFGIVFSMGLIGMVAGGMVLAPFGDRFGRRWLILASCLLVVTATYATAFTSSVAQIAGTRFLTSLGLGAMMPALVAITYEAAPPARRTLYVATLMSGFPMGGFLGGAFAAWYLQRHSWNELFVAMAFIGLLVLCALYATLERQVEAPQQKTSPRLSTALLKQAPIRMTMIVWLLFFATLLNIYLLASWLPSLLERGGISASRATFATSLMNFGGMLGGPVLSLLVARFGERSLALIFVAGALSLAGLGSVTNSYVQVVILCFLVGLMLAGGQACNSAVAAAKYPAAVRATGIGWALGIGRLGAILAPSIVSTGLHYNLSNQAIFMIATVFAVVSAVAALLLSYQPTPPDNL